MISLLIPIVVIKQGLALVLNAKYLWYLTCDYVFPTELLLVFFPPLDSLLSHWHCISAHNAARYFLSLLHASFIFIIQQMHISYNVTSSN